MIGTFVRWRRILLARLELGERFFYLRHVSLDLAVQANCSYQVLSGGVVGKTYRPHPPER